MDKKLKCKFGSKCYRKNKEHLENFAHESSDHVKSKITNEKKLINLIKGENNGETNKEARKRQTTLEFACSDKKKMSKLESNKNESASGTSNFLNEIKFIKENFGVMMPSDFFAIWELAKSLDSACPSDAFRMFHDAELVGPFDVLAGKFKTSNKYTETEYFTHCRYSTDLPELQTVIISNIGHYGYWRDDPENVEEIIVAFVPGKKQDDFQNFPKYSIVGDNLFATLRHLTKNIGEKGDYLLEKIEKFAKNAQIEMGISTEKTRARKKKIVASTLHGIGIVVPVVNDVGYRNLAETDETLRKIINCIGNTDDEDLRTAKRNDLQELNHLQILALMEVHVSDAEQVFIIHGVQEGVRNDGRSPADFRPVIVETEILSTTSGSSRVGVKVELSTVENGLPKGEKPTGKMRFFVDCSANATPLFEGKGGEDVSELISSSLNDAYKVFDLSSLAVSVGKAWTLYIDVIVLQCGGNTIDIAAIAVKAALSNTTIPSVRLKASDADKIDVELTEDSHFDCWSLNMTTAPLLITVSKLGWSNLVDATLTEEACIKSSLLVAVDCDCRISLIRQLGSGSLEPDSVDEMLTLAVVSAEKMHSQLERRLAEISNDVDPIDRHLLSAVGFLA